MKIIRLTEAQHKKIFKETFSFEVLKKLNSDRMKQYYYCVKLLGKPIGKGSSRYVFGVDDDFCVKLCMGKKAKAGIMQNMNEYKKYANTKSPLLMKVFDYDSTFQSILCEKVKQAEESDVERLLGMPFIGRNGESNVDFVNLLSYIFVRYVKGSDYFEINEECEKIIKKSEWFQELIKLMISEKITDIDYIENIGVAERNGKETLVLLDFGFTNEVYDANYK